MYLIHIGQFHRRFLRSDMLTPARDHLKVLGATPGRPPADSVTPIPPPQRRPSNAVATGEDIVGTTLQLRPPLTLDAATGVESLHSPPKGLHLSCGDGPLRLTQV